MPRYHFHVHDGVDIPDPVGRELLGLVAARAEALMIAGQVIMDAGKRADMGEEWSVEVSDGTGLLLFRMDFVVAESAATGRVLRRPGKPEHH